MAFLVAAASGYGLQLGHASPHHATQRRPALRRERSLEVTCSEKYTPSWCQRGAAKENVYGARQSEYEECTKFPRRVALRLLACLSIAPRTLLPATAKDEQPSEGFMTESGLRYFEFQEGNGATPRYGQLIRLNFVAYTVDVTGAELSKYDSTYDRNQVYFTKHGNGQTIRGIEEAVHTMKPGGRRRVIVPPGPLSYAIGDKGPLPPYQQGRDKMFGALTDGLPLVFDVELMTVMDDLLDRGDYDEGDESDMVALLQAKAKARQEMLAEGGEKPPAVSPDMNEASAPESEAEAKRRQLREMGLSMELSGDGQAAAAAKVAGAAK